MRKAKQVMKPQRQKKEREATCLVKAMQRFPCLLQETFSYYTICQLFLTHIYLSKYVFTGCELKKKDFAEINAKKCNK